MAAAEEEIFIKGFNAGYELQRLDSELLNSLLRTPNNDSEYIKGLIAGKKEYVRERMQSKLQEKDNDRNKERER